MDEVSHFDRETGKLISHPYGAPCDWVDRKLGPCATWPRESEVRHPWETAGTRHISEAKWHAIMIPEPTHPWADLIDIRPRQNGKITEMVDRHLASIVTSAPTAMDVRFDPESFARAVDTIIKAKEYERDRYVIGHAKWHAIMENASPTLRAELESLVENGTVILSGHLPDPDTAYRIQLPKGPYPWNR